MAKPVSLNVHKNTVESRRKRGLAKSATAGVEKIIRDNDVRAYAFVAIAADGRAYCIWDTGAILPMWAFASTVESALTRDIEASGVDEDWRPALTPKGST